MKNIVIFLVALTGCLGVNAQPTAELREHKNPTIEGLVEYAKSMGLNVVTAYANYGHYVKVHRISIQFRSDKPYYQEQTKQESESAQRTALRLDSMYITQNHHAQLMLDSIRSACKALAKVARESNIWESHEDGNDTISYAILLGHSIMNSTKNTETVTFTYKPSHDTSYNGSRAIIGDAEFAYNYSTNDFKPATAPIDAQSFMTVLKEIFQRKGDCIQPFYIYNDSIHDYRKDVWLGDITNNPQRWKTEQTGLLCITSSMKTANQILDEIVQATWAHLDKHPNIMFHMDENRRFHPRSRVFDKFISFKQGESETFLIELYRVIGKDDYYIMARDIKGSTVWTPKGWSTLRSYKNGKFEYYELPDTIKYVNP